MPNNQEFWAEIQKIGRSMSLISSKEAKKFGGKSDVTEGTAVDVRQVTHFCRCCRADRDLTVCGRRRLISLGHYT